MNNPLLTDGASSASYTPRLATPALDTAGMLMPLGLPTGMPLDEPFNYASATLKQGELSGYGLSFLDYDWPGTSSCLSWTSR